MDLLLSSSSSSIRGILQDRLEGMTPRAADATRSRAVLNNRPAAAIIIVIITIVVVVAVSILLLRRRKGRPIPDQKGA